MSKQGSDPTVLNSSISLLQERFKQLQRVREKRELHRPELGGRREGFFPVAGERGSSLRLIRLALTPLSMAVGLLGHAGVPQSFGMIKEKDHVDTSLRL